MADVWVVTVVHGRHEHLANQLRGLAISDPSTSHVVVAIDDLEVGPICTLHRGQRVVRVLDVPGHPLGLPLSSARNEGVNHALTEGAELVVLLDVDCLAGVGTIDRYVAAAAATGPSLLCGPVTYLPEDVALPGHPARLEALRHPHPVRPDPPSDAVQRRGDMNLFWSLSVALTPATWSIVGGSARTTSVTEAKTPTSAGSQTLGAWNSCGWGRRRLPPAPPRDDPASGAPRRHHPQCRPLPRQVGDMAHERLARGVRRARTPRLRRRTLVASRLEVR